MDIDFSKRGQIAFCALIVGAVFISVAPILVRVSELEPNATAFQRVFLGLPLLYFLMLKTQKKSNKSTKSVLSKKHMMLLLLPGIFFAGDLGFWHWSIRYTTIANATLLANFAPIYVTLSAVFLFKESVRKEFLIALVIAIVGVVILMGTSVSLGDDFVKGDILGMIAAIFYAAYIITVARLRVQYSTVEIMYWSSLSAAIILLPICLMTGDKLIPETNSGWGILISLALISHVGGQGLIAYALAHLSMAFSSVSLLIQPICAALLAWVIFSEYLTSLQILGGVIVLFGIYLARRASIYNQ